MTKPKKPIEEMTEDELYIEERLKSRRKIRRESYFTVWGFMYTDFNLTMPEMVIYSLILGFYRSGKDCNASAEYLCLLTKQKKSTVYAAIKNLLNKDYIRCDYTVGRGRSMPIYRVNEELLPKDISFLNG